MPLATRLAAQRGHRAVAAGFALMLGAAPALAQTAPAPAAPRPAAPATPRPAQPPAAQPQPGNQNNQIPTLPQTQAQQPAANAPMVVQVKAEPSQPDWTKVCGKDQAANAEICYTTRDFVSDQGQPVLAVAIYDVKGQQANQQQRIVRFLMPLGLLLQPGVRFGVDQGQPTPGRYAICFQNGCFAEAPVTVDFINAMKRGTTLNVSVQNQGGREVTFAVPAAGFGKAFDGPPIDPKVVEEQQRKLQEELEKRSEELRKRLEQSSTTPGAAPAAAAPTAAAAPAARPAAPGTAPRQ